MARGDRPRVHGRTALRGPESTFDAQSSATPASNTRAGVLIVRRRPASSHVHVNPCGAPRGMRNDDHLPRAHRPALPRGLEVEAAFDDEEGLLVGEMHRQIASSVPPSGEVPASSPSVGSRRPRRRTLRPRRQRQEERQSPSHPLTLSHMIVVSGVSPRTAIRPDAHDRASTAEARVAHVVCGADG